MPNTQLGLMEPARVRAVRLEGRSNSRGSGHHLAVEQFICRTGRELRSPQVARPLKNSGGRAQMQSLAASQRKSPGACLPMLIACSQLSFSSHLPLQLSVYNHGLLSPLCPFLSFAGHHIRQPCRVCTFHNLFIYFTYQS